MQNTIFHDRDIGTILMIQGHGIDVQAVTFIHI